MADQKNNKEYDELIDVSEFESELADDDALTEIAHPDDEEVTPIRKRSAKKRAKKKAPKTETTKGGTYVATLRERFAALFIDCFILFYVYWLYAPLYARVFLGRWGAPTPYSGWHGIAFHGSFLLICFLYYFILEGIFLATLGKFICWMSICTKGGQPASLISVFIRNLLRPVDYILILPAVFTMELTKKTQRLGDLVAGTTVVKKFGREVEPYDTSPEHIASASGRTVALTIDTLLFCLFIFGYILILTPKDPFMSYWLTLFLPLAILLYFILLEMITETSPGKWLAGYIISHEGGRRITISGSLVRTLWRIVDTNTIGLLCIFLSSKHQRPGDTAASTVVIKGQRTAKGGIGFILAVALAITTLYLGANNNTNILSKQFKFNFLPKLSFLSKLGIYAPQFESIVIDNFRFAAGEPNNVRVPPTYNPGETVYLVFELFGYEKKSRKVWLQEDLSVRYPDGSIGLSQKNIVDYQQVVKGSGPIELSNNISLPKNAKPGQYEVNITIRDKYAGSEITKTKIFYVKRTFSNIDKELSKIKEKEPKISEPPTKPETEIEPETEPELKSPYPPLKNEASEREGPPAGRR